MKRIKTVLTGFILGDWLGMPYRGKGKGTFKPIWTKSYLRGDKCSGNTSMLLCALDSRCNLELYQQNLRNWYFNLKSATTRLYDTEAKIICIVSKKGAQCIECHHKDI